jgi:cell division protein FtsW
MLQIMPAFTIDKKLIFACLFLLLLGLVMVASTSMTLAQKQFTDPLHYFWKQLNYTGLGLSLAILVLFFPINWWRILSVFLLLFGIILLILVLIPGIGHVVNGSMRWLNLGGFNFQPSELMKLLMILYLSGYLIRRSQAVRESLHGFINAMAVLIFISSLILLEPDYGTTIVLFATVLGMLFLAGVPIQQFILWVIIVSVALSLLILLAPYRLERLTAFMNPWADPFNSGFQLTQALIAIGRGELWGVGLGNSVQKLTYLPEAHTDFLFAILAEELGLSGVVLVIGLFGFIVLRAFAIAIQAERQGLHYAAYVGYGIGLTLGLQASMNLGVNMGLLPTKGLTLPFMSYGGSSMVVSCMMLALLLRIDYEIQRHLHQQKIGQNSGFK